MVVTNLTTPANFFHLIRRQLAWEFRKPCFVLSPKVCYAIQECIQSSLNLQNPLFRRLLRIVIIEVKLRK